jgi:hypothetical protein
MNTAPPTPLVLLTRFSVRSAKFMRAAGIDGEPDRQRWFEHRAALFRAITLPSVQAQTCQPDRWLLLFSAGDEGLVARHIGALPGWVVPVFLSPGTTVAAQLNPLILSALDGRRSLLISRLDSDDALRPDFFERIAKAVPADSDDRFFLYRHGCRWDGERVQQVDYPNNPFLTAYVRDWPSKRTNPLEINHATVLSHPHSFVYAPAGAAWLQVLHGANASNEFLPAHGPATPAPSAPLLSAYRMLPAALAAIHAMRSTWAAPAALAQTTPPDAKTAMKPAAKPIAKPVAATANKPAKPPADAAAAPALDTKTARSRRLNQLGQLVGFRSYLEIGVATGATFFEIDVERKVGVDPRYRFDVTTHTDPRATFHTLTSNDYFTGPGFGESFDLMFVDGLHTFEQTLTDFHATLQMAHARSIILVDDTVPNDVFSAVPNQKLAFKYRAKTGNKSLVWHGDVYKLIVYIHDFLPMLSYMTFMSGGNPQTVVWREPRPRVEPVCGNLEKVSRLDYFWLMENFAVMNGAPEPEVMARVKAWAGQGATAQPTPPAKAA